MSSWHNDFNWSWKGVVYKETGADIRFSKSLFKDIFVWIVYVISEKARSLFRPRPYIISVLPGTIRPWYMIWGVLTRAGFKIKPAQKAKNADVQIYFLDESITTPPNPVKELKSLNFYCNDISKTKVANAFKNVFDYPLAVDPETHAGSMVEKSEGNGQHDGNIVNGPLKPRPGMVYQKVVNNETDDGHVADLRCPTLFGRPLLVYIKERPIGKRFRNMNARARIEKPEDIFSSEELGLISQYCQKMHLDFGGIDVLRDRDSGQIYIVDVNKTDMIPLVLPLKEKLRAMDIMAKAFIEELIEDKRD